MVESDIWGQFKVIPEEFIAIQHWKSICEYSTVAQIKIIILDQRWTTGPQPKEGFLQDKLWLKREDKQASAQQ